MAKIDGCGGCGNCMDFKCIFGAFEFKKANGYSSAYIDYDKCTDCGKCTAEIECLCEAIKES